MTFLPIAERELRVAARRPVTFWIRFGTALGCLILWLVLAAGNRGTSGEFSRNLFTAFSLIAFAFALLSGLTFTADCLSEEKREGTLGLLFLTELKGYDVVLGKLAATSIHGFFATMAVFPVLALPLLMGGVTVGEFWRLLLVILATLVFSLGIGMLSSACSREARQTFAGTLLGLIVFSGGLPAFWWLITSLFRLRLDFVLIPSPAYCFRAAYEFCYGTSSG